MQKKKIFLLICIILNWKSNDRSEKAIFNRSRMHNSTQREENDVTEGL